MKKLKVGVFQASIDDLIDKAVKIGGLDVNDEHITGNVFNVVEHDTGLRAVYDGLCANYKKPDTVNNMIGRRTKQKFKQRSGRVIAAKSRTALAKTYKLLH